MWMLCTQRPCIVSPLWKVRTQRPCIVSPMWMVCSHRPCMVSPMWKVCSHRPYIVSPLWKVRTLGNSVGVAFPQPRVEVRSASTLGAIYKRWSNAVSVALSRRRYPQQDNGLKCIGEYYLTEYNAFGKAQLLQSCHKNGKPTQGSGLRPQPWAM